MKKINRNGSLFKCFWQEIVVIITSIALFVTLGVLKKKQDDIDVSIETSNATVSGITYEDVLYVVKEGDSLSLIAEYFGVSIDYLLGRVDSKTSNNTSTENGLVIGLSRENRGVLTEEDKEEITRFAEYVANRRKEGK